MKKGSMIIVTLALVTIYGCYSSSGKGGSVLKGEGFKIAVPTFETDIKQGEVQSVTVSLERGESFKQDVKLMFKTTKGISVEPTDVMVKASDTPDVQLRITVPKTAALGVYSVSVEGTPKTGEPTSTSFDMRVVTP
ncbi:MAG: hypothetical protein ABSE89_12105 [Sedimentisphaerales bacterium]